MRRIDADELKTAIEDRIDHIPSNDYDEGWNAALNTAIDEIDNAPTVETSKIEHKAYNEGFKDGVEQGIKLSETPGEWISQFDYSQQHKTMPSEYGNFWWCNKCDSSTEKKSNFCPNCGADMRGNK